MLETTETDIYSCVLRSYALVGPTVYRIESHWSHCWTRFGIQWDHRSAHEGSTHAGSTHEGGTYEGGTHNGTHPACNGTKHLIVRSSSRISVRS